MKNIRDMIILSVVLALVFAVVITKVSFAYQGAVREDDIRDNQRDFLLVAAESYVKSKSNEFKETENFIYGSDLIEAGFLLEIEELDFKNTKIKVTYDENLKNYHAEIVE